MTTMTNDATATMPPGGKLGLCSVVAQAVGEDPIGSAWSTDRCLMVEAPLPWPEIFVRSPRCSPDLAAILLRLHHEVPGLGIIGIAPDDTYSRESFTRVVDFKFTAPPRGRTIRREFLVPTETVADFIERMYLGDASDEELRELGEQADFTGRDLLVCTHGTVDACCATFGYPLYNTLRALAEPTDGDVRVWRSTHFGGHRFSPTVLDLPEGRYWGFLSDDTANELVFRQNGPESLRACYRGWAGYEAPEAQLLEREAFVHEGWQWTEWPQQCDVLQRDADGKPVRLRITAHPDAVSTRTYEGRIEAVGEVETMLQTGGELSKRTQYRIADFTVQRVP